MTEIASIISAVGFPIVACCGLGWYVWQLDKAHKAEVKQLAEVITNNTKAIEKLIREVHNNG